MLSRTIEIGFGAARWPPRYFFDEIPISLIRRPRRPKQAPSALRNFGISASVFRTSRFELMKIASKEPGQSYKIFFLFCSEIERDWMSVETWARKVVAAVLIELGERAPVDAVLVDFLDEFEDLSRTTKLKIPAFARALTAAGLTLASGAPYDGATLRTQISRARTKRQLQRDRAEIRPIATTLLSPPTVPDKQLRLPERKSIQAPQPAVTGENELVLMKLAQSKPKRSRSLDADES